MATSAFSCASCLSRLRLWRPSLPLGLLLGLRRRFSRRPLPCFRWSRLRLRVEVADLEAYKVFHTDVLGTLPQVTAITSYVVMDSPKDERA